MFSAGDRHFTDYPLLRATLNALLVHRPPGVELLMVEARGMPMLAASQATTRGLKSSTFVPGDAEERRDAYMVADVAGALEWLLGPDAGWVTGQVLGIDGGLATVRPR